MKMNDKHKSKLHKGFIKQVSRHNKKPDLTYIELKPIKLSYNEETGEYEPLKQCFRNNKWNGINLIRLCNTFNQVMPDWLHSKVLINREGKYILSPRGKQILNRKRIKNY